MDIKILDEKNFKTEVEEGNWLVMFWASWCGPCIDTTYLQEFQKLNKNWSVAKVNIEENFDLSSNYSITIVPTYILYKNGHTKKKIVGLQSLQSLQKAITL